MGSREDPGVTGDSRGRSRRALLTLGATGGILGVSSILGDKRPAHAASTVNSVNGMVGDVVLRAADVKALPSAEFNAMLTVAVPSRFAGLDPTGAKECAGPMQAALDAVSPGGVLFIPPGRYRMGKALVAPPNITISAPHGQAVLVRDGHTDITLRAYGSHSSPIAASGVPTTSAITVNGHTTGITRVNLASAPTSWKAGDIVKIYSDDAIPGGRRVSGSTSIPRIGEYMRIHEISGRTLTLNGYAFENYKTNIRVVKLDDKTITINGLAFDVSDGSYADPSAPECTVRCDSMRAPHLINVRVVRAVGIAIQMRSCAGYYIENADVSHAINNAAAGIFGYGIHDVASNDGTIVGGIIRFVRHGYTDKSTESPPNSPYPSFYGRTLFPKLMGVEVVAPSLGAFDTHQESYGVHFDGCIARVSTGDGFSIRGSGHRISNCTVVGGSVGVNVFTENSGGVGTGETRDIHVTDLRTENTVVVVQSMIRNSAHEQQGIQDTERNLTVDGVHAQGAARFATIINSRARITNFDIAARDLPYFVFFQNSNSRVELTNGTIDFEAVARTENNRNRILRSSATTPSPSSQIVIRGLRVKASPFYASQCAVGPFETDATTDVDVRVELEVPFPVMPGTIGKAPRVTFGWSTWTKNDSSSASLASSASVTYLNAALAGSMDALTRAPDANLLLVASINDGQTRTLGKLGKARHLGQRLTILVATANSGATLRVLNGSVNGVTLNGVSAVALGPGGQLHLFWSGSSWRQLIV